MEVNPNSISDELLAAFLDGNVDAAEARQVLDAMGGDSEVAEILALAPVIDAAAEAEELRIIPMRALAAAGRDNLCSIECEAAILQRLGYDADHWTLLETAKANNWLRGAGTPLHHVGRLLELKGLWVERKYDATLQDIADALDADKEVIAVVDRDVLEGRPAGPRAAMHAVGLSSMDDIADRDRFVQAWQRSGCYMVVASPEQGGYNPQPISVDDICLDADLEDLTEAIAENAHDIWARARMDEGWTYGPERDDAARRHPDLVPYSMLPESEKEYDRLMAMNTLRLVRRLGFTIGSGDPKAD